MSTTGPARSERRRLASMVSVRFTPDEETLVRDAAVRSGESLSNYIRQAALQACASDGPRVTVSWSRPQVSSGVRQNGTASSTTLATFSA